MKFFLILALFYHWYRKATEANEVEKETIGVAGQSRFFKIDARSVIGFVVSGFLLWLLFRQSRLEWKQLQQLYNNPRALVCFCLASLFGLVVVYLQSVRTRIVFIDRHTTINDTSSFPSLVVGYFYNSVLPGNLGEAVRAWHFSRINRKPLNQAIAVITLEKFLDANFMSPVLVITLLSIPFTKNLFASAIAGVVAMIISADILLYAMLKNKKIKQLFFAPFTSKKIRRVVYRIFCYHIGHLRRLGRNNTLKWYGLTAYAMYVVNGLQHFIILYGMNTPETMFSFTNFNLLNLCMMFVAIIPSAPGNVGVAHYGLYATLLLCAQLSGAPASPVQFALVAIAIHLSYFIPEVLLGVVFIIKERKYLFSK